MAYQIHQRDAELRGEAEGKIEKIAKGVGYTADAIRKRLGLAPA